MPSLSFFDSTLFWQYIVHVNSETNLLIHNPITNQGNTTMSIKLFKEDNNIFIRGVSDSNIVEHVPPAVYRLRENPMSGEVILVMDRASFEVPAKCYGKHNANKDAILKAYNSTDGATGVVLRGIKGAGKSVLAEDLGKTMVSNYMPVIMVDVSVSRRALHMATQMAGPCMMYFDEFGKVFEAKERRDLLTYFSDSSFKKVLFVVTSNSKKELDKYFINRPGRFLFMIEYKSLDPLAIIEMIDDHGITGEMGQMLNAYVEHRQVTFDMLRFLMPLAAEAKDYLEFNDRISILNCPAPVYPHLTVDKVIYKGQPFYGYAKIIPQPGRKYTLELRTETSTEALAVIDFDMTTRHSILEQSFLRIELQFALNDDVILIAGDRWCSSLQTTDTQQLRDPEVITEDKIERSSPMRSHLFGSMGIFGSDPVAPSMSSEQKQLLEMAQHIIEQNKAAKPAEPTAPADEPQA